MLQLLGFIQRIPVVTLKAYNVHTVCLLVTKCLLVSKVLLKSIQCVFLLLKSLLKAYNLPACYQVFLK